MKIILHINQLVLDGFPAMDAQRLGRVIERELAVSLAALPAARWKGAAVDRVASPITNTSAITNHDALGRGVARALQSAISTTQTEAKALANQRGGPQ
jgi:hypothetical protein